MKMKMKNVAVVGMVAITMMVGAFCTYAKPTEPNDNQANSGIYTTSPRQMATEIAKDATDELTQSELKKLNIPEFNLPANPFVAYKASHVLVTEKGFILRPDNGKGFLLKKGDIVRVNSVAKDATTREDATYAVGYVKGETYTSTSVGNMNAPTTAWSVMSDEDAGEYGIYIQSDNEASRNNSFDVIITIETPAHILGNSSEGNGANETRKK